MKATRALETKSLVYMYGLLLALSMSIDFYYGGSPFRSWMASTTASTLAWTLAGFFILFFILGSSICLFLFSWAQELQKVFAQVLTPISHLQAIVLALVSGFIEEWFFRGILLNHFGLILSSLVFGLAHLIPSPRLLIWAFINFFAGIALGLLYQHSGSLVLVAFTHSTVNAISILKLNRDIARAHAIG